MNRRKERGSAHAIIIVLLVIALLGALGFVFYQNFIQKPSTTPLQVETPPPPESAIKEVKRVAFGSKIYALDYPAGWTITTEAGQNGASKTILLNPDKTIRVTFDVSDGSLGGVCVPDTERKVRYYAVGDTKVTKLNDSEASVVEAMTDAEGGGYDYYIGLTQDGGATHAAVGEPYCTVLYVGVASRLVMSNNTDISPTIIATIDFPKLTAGTDKRVKEMQQVKDMMASDDYRAAVKILESARRE